MRRFAMGMVVVVAFAAGGAGVAARQASVTASGGWIAEPPPDATATSGYVAIENPTMYDVYVVSVTSDAAGRLEFREAVPGDNQSKTVKVLTVPAYGTVDLAPNGVHLLLLDLKRPLKAGDTVSLTLTTDAGVTMKVAAVVRKE